MRLAIAAALVGASLVIAVAAEVPRFDIQAICGSADAKQCVSDEQSARDELFKNWSKYSVADQNTCSQMAAIANQPSYVALITCLQMTVWDREERSKKK